jgi:hypothetical protein
MPSASFTLTEQDTVTDVVFTLAGSTSKGAIYKVTDRSLALPQTLEFTNNIGNPGSKGNDHVVVSLKNTVQNGDTGLVSTGSLKMDLSIPRDSAWTSTDTEDLMAFLVDLLGTGSAIANLADGINP